MERAEVRWLNFKRAIPSLALPLRLLRAGHGHRAAGRRRTLSTTCAQQGLLVDPAHLPAHVQGLVQVLVGDSN